jgi:hypothetical protein
MREPLFPIDRTVVFPPKPRRGPKSGCLFPEWLGVRITTDDLTLLTRYAQATGQSRPNVLRGLLRGLREPLMELEKASEGGER